VVHQIRNACKYVVWKDRKEFTSDMKNIYTAPNRQAAEAALNDFAKNGKQNMLMLLNSGRITGMS